MAVVGDILLTPEEGWKRYESPHTNFNFSGSWVHRSQSGASDGNDSYTQSVSSVSFKFYGTQLRIISAQNFDHSSNVTITIDGVSYTASAYYASLKRATLLFEKLNLSLSIHEVTVTNNSTSTSYLVFDAIDINDTGRLIHPYLTEKYSLSDLEIGDVISCEYTASSGTFGTFANLGSATKDLIPLASSATPDGNFYFIHTGYDHLGRMKLVADRVIQRNISWDKLNEAGIAGAENIISIDNKDFHMRLLSGGVSATDKDNEWDKIIVESDLDGKIQAGSSVWNWSGISSWTLTTPSSSRTNRVLRGNSSASARLETTASSGIATTIGFRPVLLVTSGIFISMVSSTATTYDQNIDIIIGLIEYISGQYDIRYRYVINEVAYSWSTYSSSDALNISVPYNLLDYGNNVIKIEVADTQGRKTSVSVEAFRKVTDLLMPEKIYFNETTLKWLPILSPEKLSSLYLKRINHAEIDELAVLYLKVDDGVIKDMIGTYPTLTVNAGTSVSTEHNINSNTIYFGSASSGTIQLSQNDALNFGTGDFTIEFWFKWENRVNTYPHIFTSSALYYGIGIGDQGTDKATFYIGTGSRVVTSTSSVTDGKWHHYAICRKNGVFQLYIDGKLESTNSSNISALIDLSNGTTIGGAYWAPEEKFNGWIDDFIVVKGKALYTENFTPSLETTLIPIVPITAGLYKDSLKEGEPYMYSILGVTINSELESNFIAINSAPDPAYFYLWQDEEYVLKLIEGIAFDSTEVDYDLYTAPNRIIIKPLLLGNLIGGKSSNVFAFEVLNTYENKDLTITLYATDADQNMAIQVDNYGEFQDSVEPELRSWVVFDYDEEFTSGGFYPAIFELNASQKKVIYCRFKPGLDSGIGQKVMYVVATTREVNFDE